ncbi:MAG: RNA 2',3'-cyclic phosphodiesterase [Calditrichaeota bacterium]|nr:MAG: RNA 2',3'-cyclic phosphodiesterase [Calditrichota bacterium]
MNPIRTFIAIELPDDLRRRIAAAQAELKQTRERVGWTRPENIHLTLRFLGDVAQERIPAVADAMGNAAAGFSVFSVTVAGLGAFPNLKRPRVLWVGVQDPGGELTELARRLENALNEIGFERERRPFRPHLTLGRVKSPPSRAFCDRLAQARFDPGQVRVSEIVLMKSDLRPTGAVYTPLNRVALSVSEKQKTEGLHE